METQPIGSPSTARVSGYPAGTGPKTSKIPTSAIANNAIPAMITPQPDAWFFPRLTISPRNHSSRQHTNGFEDRPVVRVSQNPGSLLLLGLFLNSIEPIPG